MRTRATELFGLDLPLFAFSHCRDVVAAVSKAGGMGVLGALAFTPEQLEIELDWIDDNVDGKPYGVDTVMPQKSVDVHGGNPEELLAQIRSMIDGRRSSSRSFTAGEKTAAVLDRLTSDDRS